MTTTDANGTPATVTAILARVILLRHNKKLPEPRDFQTNSMFYRISVELGCLDDFNIWLKELGGKRSNVQITRFDHVKESRHNHYNLDFGVEGWKLNLFVDVPRGERSDSGLDADTVAVLEAVA